MDWEKARTYAPAVLRYGLTVVFFWFGISQLTNPSGWLGFLPGFAASIANPVTLVYLNGAFEIVLAVFLGLGLYIRLFSGLTALQLLSIVVFSVGLSAIGIRDFGLMIAALAVFLHGPDKLCLDMKRKK